MSISGLRTIALSACCAIIACFISYNVYYNTSIYMTLGSLIPVSGNSDNAVPTLDLTWHPPNSTLINDLPAVINTTGTYGFIFNRSDTPQSSPYDTYNWCNMPHVRAQEYVEVDAEYDLRYVELIHRHHKRTPYGSNLFPIESESWNCDSESLFYFGALKPGHDAAAINWQVYSPSSNPLTLEGPQSSCQFPQITREGLVDSQQHGEDLFKVYHDLLGFLPDDLDPSKISFRVTNNIITSQVASQVVYGMYPEFNHKNVSVLVQPSLIDSLEPAYSCLTASSLYASYGVGSEDKNWTAHLDAAAPLFQWLDSVSGVNTSDNEWHNWFDHYLDNLSARTCHGRPLPCNVLNSSQCVTEADADAVFRLGEYEYSYIYRDSPQSLQASTASFGIWMAELVTNLRDVMDGTGDFIYRHNIAHDGSIARLLSILQVDVMVWPGMGSEVVFELYEKKFSRVFSSGTTEASADSDSGTWFLRVLWGGQILRSSHPALGQMDLIPVERLFLYVDGLVGAKAREVPQLCGLSLR